MGYTKVFASLITSTVWGEDHETRIVWITMLALADRNGEVQGSIPGLAHMARVPIEKCRSALDKFMSPDPESRTPDCEGRRIEKIDGGWAIINHAKYRRLASKEDAVEKNAERQRRFKERKTVTVTQGNASVTLGNAQVTQDRDIAEAEAEAEADKKDMTPLPPKGGGPPARRAARLPANWRPDNAGRAFAADRGLDPDSTADAFADYWAAASGRTSAKLDWNAAFRTWCRRDATRPMVQAADRPVQPARGRGAFLEQLAAIASRDDDDEPGRQ